MLRILALSPLIIAPSFPAFSEDFHLQRADRERVAEANKALGKLGMQEQLTSFLQTRQSLLS